jgi:hypothetical protein
MGFDDMIDIDLVPSEEDFGRLRGNDGNIVAQARYQSFVHYNVYCPIRVHGKCEFEGETKDASLLVFACRSSSQGKKRIKKTTLELSFYEEGAPTSSQNALKIVNYAPDEQKILLEETSEDQEKETKHAAEFGLQASAAAAAVAAKYKPQVSNKVTKEVTFAASVWGAADGTTQDMEYPNRVTWTSEENPSSKKSVPGVIRFPLLLIRPSKGNVVCYIKINEELEWNALSFMTEWWYKVKKWHNRAPKKWSIDVTKFRQDQLIIPAETLGQYLEDKKIRSLVKIDVPLSWKQYRGESNADDADKSKDQDGKGEDTQTKIGYEEEDESAEAADKREEQTEAGPEEQAATATGVSDDADPKDQGTSGNDN